MEPEHHSRPRRPRRQKDIISILIAGFGDVEVWKREVQELNARKAALEAALAEPTLPALHPHMADVFRRNTEQLAAALEHEGQRDAARETLRGFIDRIVIPPGDGLLRVVGNLGEMLTAASGRNGSVVAAVGNGGCGGPQQIVPAALLGGSVNTKTLAFLTEVPGARRLSLG